MINYLITVNQEEISIAKSDIATLDLIKVDEADFHLLQDSQAYKIKLLHTDYSNKSMEILVNGNKYKLKIEDGYDIQVREMGLLVMSSQKENLVNAPMPGLIIDIMVQEGQNISKGTPLLVLSAMKMENIILSPSDGTVKSIMAKKEDTVEKGQLIIEIE